ncbi:MAG: NFACT family protein, partial [Planctomycetes bacterium]|nr:NFACT family protein [Planctomycetota bacterium]
MDLQRAGRARLNLDTAQVAALARELHGLVRGARVKEVVGLPPADVVLVLEPADPDARGVLRVRVSADPEAPRLHVQHERVERHDGPLGPFFRRAQSELLGATLAECVPVAGDRIALFECREAAVGERRALVLELFGRHANL